MTFTTLVEKQSAPYWIIIKGNNAWRVGPKDDTKPEEDVQWKSEGSAIACTLIDGKGTPVFVNDVLSPQFIALMGNIPKDRVPDFCFDQAGADTLFKLRQVLKQMRIFHGLSIHAQVEPFRYDFIDEVKYEY